MQAVDLSIELLDMPYPVLRHVRVPAAILLADLHKVFQAALPWEDGHLYDYKLGRSRRWAKPERGHRGGAGDARKARLDDLLAEMERKTSFPHTHDLGDNWEHEISLGKPVDMAPGEAAIARLAAEGACPPDDSGEAPGFPHLLEVASNPSHDEHEDMVHWLGDLHPWKPAAAMAALTAKVQKLGARIVKKF